MLNVISHTQKDKYCMITLSWGIQNNQIYEIKDYNGGYQGVRRGRHGKLWINKHKVFVKQDEYTLEICWTALCLSPIHCILGIFKRINLRLSALPQQRKV